jgi:AraC family transcriptional regulator, regulatory protein of adaptative response / methylated-DNA-[protein]-cysteine methyltransferase
MFEFSDRKSLEQELLTLSGLLNSDFAKGINKHIEALILQIDEYFKGDRKEFILPLFMPGTEFQQSVWHELIKIEYGTTRTYLEQAEALGKPDAIRAVAHANGLNRMSIIVPCHRVIGSDGSLTGYGGGLWRKKWLLDFEKFHSGRDNALFSNIK